MWRGKPKQIMCVDVATICAFDQHELVNIINMSSNKKQRNIIVWVLFFPDVSSINSWYPWDFKIQIVCGYPFFSWPPLWIPSCLDSDLESNGLVATVSLFLQMKCYISFVTANKWFIDYYMYSLVMYWRLTHLQKYCKHNIFWRRSLKTISQNIINHS